MRHYPAVLALIILLAGAACKTSKQTTANDGSTTPPPSCNTHATFVDYSGLDGCKWLLITDDGQKLLPQNLPPDFEPYPYMEVMVNFKDVPDAVSNCMAEGKIVSLSCIQPLQAKPLKPECYDVTDPTQVNWMRIAMIRNHTKIVEKFQYLDKWAYLFKGADLNNDLYDCQGNFLCSYREIDQNECSERRSLMGQSAIIWSKDR